MLNNLKWLQADFIALPTNSWLLAAPNLEFLSMSIRSDPTDFREHFNCHVPTSLEVFNNVVPSGLSFWLNGFQQLKVLLMHGLKHYEFEFLPLGLESLSLVCRGTSMMIPSEILHVKLPKLEPLHNLTHITLGAVGLDNQAKGVFGLCIDEIWNHCSILTIDTDQLLLSYSVTNKELVVDFERPYREGDYLPPHILANMHAVFESNAAADRSVMQLLDGFAKSRLQLLEFRGNCHRSIKLVPRTESSLTYDPVVWLHSVMSQRIDSLYGLNYEEFRAKVDIMEGNVLKVSKVKGGFNIGQLNR